MQCYMKKEDNSLIVPLLRQKAIHFRYTYFSKNDTLFGMKTLI